MKTRAAKRIGVLFLVLLLTLTACPLTASAASRLPVPASIPWFPVTIGGVTLDSLYEEYPVIFFNDITYLPLTYYGCQLLGLYVDWGPEKGLIISDMGTKGEYVPYRRAKPNPGTLTAVPATGRITIKGTPIDNATEEWPFLFFRDITYIPLTWRNMHDLLGCDYAWDPVNGLVIDRAVSEASNVLRLPLSENNRTVQAYAGYFWYTNGNGDIARTPMTGGPSEFVYEMPINSFIADDQKAVGSFWMNGDNLYLGYHVGGAIMGSDYVLRLDPDGTVSSPTGTNVNPDDGRTYFNSLRGEYLKTDGYDVIAYHWPANSYNNLRIRRDGEADWTALGEPGYLYGSTTTEQENGGLSYNMPNSGYLYESNGKIYTLAHNSFAKADPAEWTEDTWYEQSWTKYYEPDLVWPQHSRVCSVDPATGETVFLTEYADGLFVEGDTIYYLTADTHVLKACDLNGKNVRTLSPDGVCVTQFTVVNGTVYYAEGVTRFMRSRVNDYEEWVYRTDDCPLYVLTAKGPKRIGTTPLVRMDASEGYLIARLAPDSETPASDPVRLAVYDGEDELYTIRGADVISAGVSDGNLYFVLR